MSDAPRMQRCSWCGGVESVVIAFGKEQVAPGWSDLVLTGRPFLGMLLCPACVELLRAFLASAQRRVPQ